MPISSVCTGPDEVCFALSRLGEVRPETLNETGGSRRGS
jgi:hypothetical protein